jgi:hypothetical protein
MGQIKEPEGVDFYADSTPLTQEDKKQISDVIPYYKRTGRKMPISNILRILLFTTAFPISFGLPQTLNAQTKIEGKYNSKTKKFEAVSDVYNIEDFRGAFATFRLYDKRGIIDTTGKVIVPVKYDEIEPFLDGVARVEIFGDYPTHYGYIDEQGNEVLPVIYTDADDWFYRSMRFSDLIVVGIDQKYGCFDKKGKKVLPLEYGSIGNYSSGLATIYKDGKMGCINKEGKIVIPIIYDRVSDFGFETATVQKDGKWGIINKAGEVVLPIIYEAEIRFSGELAITKLNGKFGAITKTGTVLIPFQFESLAYFREGLAHAILNGKHGFINEKGVTIIPFEYDWAGNFNQGFVNVKKDNLWGHLNLEGKITTPLEYEQTGDFNRGVANVKKNGKSGRVNTEGKLVLPCKYDGINGSFSDGRMIVSINFPEGRKKGFVDEAGNEVIQCIYYDVKPFSGGKANAQKEKDGKWIFIDVNGKEVN